MRLWLNLENLERVLNMRKKILLIVLFVGTILLLLGISLFLYIPALNENQTLYLSSTLSQVAATLFGLSITGYIFLEDKLSKDVEKDETLTDVIDNLKFSYRHILLFGSAVTGLSILLCVLNILFARDETSNAFLQYIINCSIVFSLVSIASTLRFVYKATDPQQIKKASKKAIKESKFSSTDETEKSNNHLQEFMLLYNQLERSIGLFIEKHFDTHSNYRQPLYKNLYFLMTSGIINDNQFQMLQEIRKYRNYLVHGDTMFVDEQTFNILKELYQSLEDSFNGYESNPEGKEKNDN